MTLIVPSLPIDSAPWYFVEFTAPTILEIVGTSEVDPIFPIFSSEAPAPRLTIPCKCTTPPTYFTLSGLFPTFDQPEASWMVVHDLLLASSSRQWLAISEKLEFISAELITLPALNVYISIS